MSWHEGKILSNGEASAGGSGTLPSAFQRGQKVKLWVFGENDKPVAIPAVVAGVSFSPSGVGYDLAFPIAGTDMHVRVNGFRGYITDEKTNCVDDDGGLIDAEKAREAYDAMYPPVPVPRLRLVPAAVE